MHRNKQNYFIYGSFGILFVITILLITSYTVFADSSNQEDYAIGVYYTQESTNTNTDIIIDDNPVDNTVPMPTGNDTSNSPVVHRAETPTTGDDPFIFLFLWIMLGTLVTTAIIIAITELMHRHTRT